MGGNGSYREGYGGVPNAERTHTDTKYRVNGHKVLVTTANNSQKKNILNSNSKDAVYLIAVRDKNSDILSVQSVNIFKGHYLVYEINLKLDKQGNSLPFNNGKGSHAHKWKGETAGNRLGRTPHDKKNVYPIDEKYLPLIEKIIAFNKKKKK